MSDVKFGSWTVADSPIIIDYSLVVVEQIRHQVAEGLQRLSRGGIEVGGVLYGTHDSGTVRLLAVRSIACEHARGPGFLLSDRDRVGLNEQLAGDKNDPHLQDLVSVGWFLSHTRTEISLAESDLELYSIFFPAPWQVTLVVRPGRGGSMRAGFFVREADGTVRSDRSYLEFNFPDRLAGVLDPPPDRPRERPPRESVDRRIPTFFRAETAAPAPASTPEHCEPSPIAQADAGPQLLATPPVRRKWPWLIAWAMVVLALVVLGLRWWMPASPEPIALAVVERDGALQIEWNRAARPVIRAARGSLEIVDGSDSRTIALTPQALALGRYAYQRKSGDVEVRMSVENAGGAKTWEASRFLGRAPSANSPDPAELEKRRADLQAEVDRLRRENAAQAAKIQQLERTLRVLETRLGIEKQ